MCFFLNVLIWASEQFKQNKTALLRLALNDCTAILFPQRGTSRRCGSRPATGGRLVKAWCFVKIFLHSTTSCARRAASRSLTLQVSLAVKLYWPVLKSSDHPPSLLRALDKTPKRNMSETTGSSSWVPFHGSLFMGPF